MTLIQGLVVRTVGSQYSIRTSDGIVQAQLRGKLRLLESSSTNPVVVGDWVDLENQDVLTISAVHDRKNKFSRKAIGNENQEQLLAANIDQLVIISSLKNPTIRYQFIDRCMISAEAFRIPVHLIFTKTDLVRNLNDQFDQIEDSYLQSADSIHLVNLVESSFPDSLRTLFIGKVSLLTGLSGVGKSTLIKQLIPESNVRIGTTSVKWEQGKHTTSFAELHEVAPGTDIIDTPGLREFALHDVDAWELSHFFREMVPYLDGCKYSKCSHTHEPVCAIKTAVENGEISARRYESYLLIYEDLLSKET